MRDTLPVPRLTASYKHAYLKAQTESGAANAVVSEKSPRSGCKTNFCVKMGVMDAFLSRTKVMNFDATFALAGEVLLNGGRKISGAVVSAIQPSLLPDIFM